MKRSSSSNIVRYCFVDFMTKAPWRVETAWVVTRDHDKGNQVDLTVKEKCFAGEGAV